MPNFVTPTVRVIASSNVSLPKSMMKVDLDSTGMEDLTEFAGRLCYMSMHKPNPATRNNADYLRRTLFEQGHWSIAEHATVTFLIEGVSRAFTHELIRHRHLSYSQLSQRFVDEEQANFVYPPALRTEEMASARRVAMVAAAQASDAYANIVRAFGNAESDHARKQIREAARAVLPNMVETKIVVTGNLRAWHEVVERRTAPDADAEIQQVMGMIRDRLHNLAPSIFPAPANDGAPAVNDAVQEEEKPADSIHTPQGSEAYCTVVDSLEDVAPGTIAVDKDGDVGVVGTYDLREDEDLMRKPDGGYVTLSSAGFTEKYGPWAIFPGRDFIVLEHRDRARVAIDNYRNRKAEESVTVFGVVDSLEDVHRGTIVVDRYGDLGVAGTMPRCPKLLKQPPLGYNTPAAAGGHPEYGPWAVFNGATHVSREETYTAHRAIEDYVQRVEEKAKEESTTVEQKDYLQPFRIVKDRAMLPGHCVLIDTWGDVGVVTGSNANSQNKWDEPEQGFATGTPGYIWGTLSGSDFGPWAVFPGRKSITQEEHADAVHALDREKRK